MLRTEELDWDSMRVDDAAVGELSEALRGNTALRTLKLQHNRQLTDVCAAAISSHL